MPFKPQNADEYFANQRMSQAAEKVAAVATVIEKENAERQLSYERFYNNLALFSSGTVALSVTYLGYLKTLPKPVVHPRWLIASWISLLVCIASSVFWSLLYNYYAHFARTREYMSAQKERYETEANEIQKINIANLQTPAELAAFIEPRRKVAEVRGQDAEYHGRRESFYERLWMWDGRLARLTFVFGLAMLLSFAIRNMNN
jgi:hypothetical protein